MPQEPLGKDNRRTEKLTRAVFFLSALLFHLVLFMAVASYVIWRTPPQPPDPGQVYVPVAQTPPSSPPRAPVDVSVAVRTPEVPRVIVDTSSSRSFNLQPPIPNIENITGSTQSHPPQPKISPRQGMPDERLERIRDTILNDWGMTPQQIADHDPKCTFPVYIASYANGDWNCNTRLDKDGNIEAGSIPDLVAKINEWSHGEINGHVVPKPLDIASPDLLAKMPPFIFFTGHKDFVLTDQEVENLRNYLINGGCIWGDNALAGDGSRFDVAFHREMKRVVPDKDKTFVPYSLDDDIFTKQKYHLSEIPAGMNYYAEAPQHLDLDGILAILYTPNDYSDMMFMRIAPGDKSFFMTYKPIPPGTLYTNTSFVEKQSIFYRNFNLDSALAVHHLGMNIVRYLLVRFDDKLLLGQ